MSGPFGSSSFNHLVSTGFYNGVATQSVRFDYGSTPTLYKTPSASSLTTWSWSAWFKLASTANTQFNIFSADSSTTNYQILALNPNTHGALSWVNRPSGGQNQQLITTQLFRDTSAWYHLVVIWDTTNSTEADRSRMYLNGSRITSFATNTQPDQNTESIVNTNIRHNVGSAYAVHSNSVNGFNGYLAEVNFVDGLALDSSYFGETKNGVWIAKNPVVSDYGQNGYRLQFKNTAVSSASSSTIGADTSGKGNHYTSGGLATTDSNMPDSPENNWSTLNSIYKTDNNNPTFTEGNLKVAPSQVAYQNTFSTIGVSSGKWYAEVRQGGATNSANYVGVADEGQFDHLQSTSYYIGSSSGSGTSYAMSMNSGNKFVEGNQGSYGSRTTDGQVIGIALDLDNGKIYFSVDGTYVNSGDPANGTNFMAENIASSTYHFGITVYTNGISSAIWNFGQDSSFGGNETATSNSDANGNGTFHTAPPSGFLALCSANLPEPTIGPNSDSNSTDHFNTVLFSGTGSSPLSVTGMGHQPDLLWLKRRDNATNGHHILYDSIRGGTNALRSSTNSAEAQFGDMVVTFASDGFSFTGTDGLNASSDYSNIAWSWLANGGTTTTNDASSTGVGTIDSVIQANTTAGFSIVTYTGSSSGTNGTPSTIAHGLGAVPKWIFFMPRDTYDGCVYHAGNTSAPATDRLILKASSSSDAAGATSDDSLFFNDTEPTSTVFSVGTRKHANSNGGMVAYCWADVEGFSKFGSYTGNLDTNGTFVYTGFKPAWLMIKNADEGGYNWYMYDNTRLTYNPNSKYLIANTSGVEINYSGDSVDFLSNGFKLRTLANGRGTNRNANHVYMAFAEAPFKYANAR